MKNPAVDRPFWGAEVNTPVKGRRSGYRVPLVSAAAGAGREGAVIRRPREQRDFIIWRFCIHHEPSWAMRCAGYSGRAFRSKAHRITV